MRLLVLTMSDKYNNYCVAGVRPEILERNNNLPLEWIRLVGDYEHSVITDAEAVYEDGTLCKAFDIIEVNAERIEPGRYTGTAFYPDENFDFQPENYLMRNGVRFVKLGSITESDFIKRCTRIVEKPLYIYCQDEDRLTVEEAAENGRSLIMVRVNQLKLFAKQKFGSQTEYDNHYKASFRYNGSEYCLTVTDPDFAREDDVQGRNIGSAYLIVSLGVAYVPRQAQDSTPYHYKLIAKIIPLPETLFLDGVSADDIKEVNYQDKHFYSVTVPVGNDEYGTITVSLNQRYPRGSEKSNILLGEPQKTRNVSVKRNGVYTKITMTNQQIYDLFNEQK